MFDKKGFTLIEIIVAIIIVAGLAAFAIPNYMTTMVQGEAKAAENNLILIYGAEKSFYLSNAIYCTSSTPGQPCNTLANINLNLPLYTGGGNSAPLNITDKYFTNYTCTATNGFQCTATSPSFPGFSLTLTNNPIVLPGGANGACTPATGGAPCNPYCLPVNSIYCPAS